MPRVSTVTGFVIIGVLLLSMKGTSMAASAFQTEPPEVGDSQVFDATGVDASFLSQAEIADLDPASSLILELIEMGPEAKIGPQATNSPELFHILAGVLTFQDNFGFASVVEAGSNVSLNPGSEYTIVNNDGDVGRVLRVRLAGRSGDSATPAVAPVTDGATTTELARVPFGNLQVDGAQFYLARAHFEAGTDTGEQAHRGPIILYIDSGTVNVVSPSGLLGTIDSGQAVNLPPETPLQASTGETESVAFIAGVVGKEDVPFERSASGLDDTATDSVLAGGQTWQTENAELTLVPHPFSHTMSFDLKYVNIGEVASEISIDSKSITVVDDSLREWKMLRSSCDSEEALAPQAEMTCSVHFNAPVGANRGPIVLTVHVAAVGEIEDVTWRVELDW